MGHQLPKGVLAAILATAGLMFTGCDSQPTDAGATAGGEGKTVSSSKLPGDVKGDIEVQSFKGGYGIDFFETAGKEFAAKNGGKVTVGGDPRVWEQLQPRFVAGNPPDVTWPGWGMDYWKLVAEGQVYELNAVLEEPGFDGKAKWRESFEESLLALGSENGKVYMLPYHINLNGWWYNKTLFEKHGWKVPTTYEELLSEGAKMKAAGVAPLTFQGQYPYYSIFGMLLPWTISNGGMKQLEDMQNLVPGAWKAEPVMKAAAMIAEMRDKGMFQKGATGMSHTESQTEFLQGKAAMIPCGTWLYSEMSKVWPAGVVAEFFLPPSPAAGQDRSNICVGIEPWIVPAKAKNPRGGVEYYKYLTSIDKAKQFVEQKGTLMGIKGANSAKVPAHLQTAAQLFGDSKAVWSAQFAIWYPSFKKEVENALAGLMNGESTPQAFCDRCEAAAEKLRQDKSVLKHVYSR